jgi:hypothetical protein
MITHIIFLNWHDATKFTNMNITNPNIFAVAADNVFSTDKQILRRFDGQFGVVVRILAYNARGCGFDSPTVQTFECMNMSVCIGSGCFYV